MESPGFNVEHGVPIPQRRNAPKRYPFRDMEIGDSFFVPLNGEKSSKVFARIAGAAIRDARSRGGIKYAVRSVEGGVRVWRVKREE